MKINSTVVLALSLLVMMVGAGTITAAVGFTMGDRALNGVKQPKGAPPHKLASKNQSDKQSETNSQASRQPMKFISEREVLVQVYDHIHGKKNQQQSAELAVAQTTQTQDETVNLFDSNDSKLKKTEFPLKSQDQRVTFVVENARPQGGSLLLDVKLQNNGSQPVKFLYSFLDVRDQDNRSLSAITDGLPGEIPANGKSYDGTIRIPFALLENAVTISLTLTDYPDQKLQLKLEDIGVTR